MEDYTKELGFAKSLALKAGEIITKNFLHSKITTKSNLTPVTETDLAVSKLVIEELKNNFPSHEVLDEELQNKKSGAEFLWVCDPVDGTIPFSHHVPTSMFSLALCKNEEPVVAITYDPFIKRLLYTKKGLTSYMSGNEISVKKGSFEKGDFVFGIPYWNEKFSTDSWVKLLLEKNVRVTYIESIVYEFMLVATGITRAMVTIAANPWDRAAGKMIVENAGGKVTDENGDRLSVFGNPQYIVATNGNVHDEILEILNKCIKR
ncbi:MAG: Myo-inositol-monophosphatase [Candidatus Roizmanbacteria bacterium GW2011_GWA2_35_8]|uniref:Myo-inositol-monophosphatase n=1 Tax=Candidatus Roizmanbacteria bacterium GW2011_GWA2_35_8 TaxID=1618479 RepID=A0A0G0CYG6_9BACT|nr:MAG: Myo-inositol-monophosphatase [Candidatus Roizmanbacteria bacterium GW2011_GWA2_35_8]